MNERREGADGLVMAVPSMSEDEPDRTFVYVGGGRPDATGTGYHDTIERAEVFDDGALGDWSTEAERMDSARAFFALVTTLGRNDVPTAPPPTDPGCPDFDGDGHAADSCGGDDCDDTDPTVSPGADEICGDGIDQDCDGVDQGCDCTEPDEDGDGYDRPECGGDDCDDLDETVYPGAEEECGDGVDQDCDGVDQDCDCAEPDVDGDGAIRPGCGGDDCDDSAATIYPGAPEIPCDGIDQDCNGRDDCIMRSTISEPIYLVAAQGDDEYTTSHGSGNTGLRSIEICEVIPPDGTLGAWTLQTNDSAHAHHGHGAVLYFDYLFTFPGVHREEPTTEPEPDPSATARFAVDIEATDPTLLLDSYEAAGATLEVQRSYYGTVRVSSNIYILGGNAGPGIGPIATLEQHHE